MFNILNMGTIRAFVHKALHEPSTQPARLINGTIILLIILSIAVIPLHFIPGIEWVHPYLFFFDRMVVTIFTVEYVLRIWSARFPFRYIVSWWGIIDLVAILPFYLARFELFANPEVFLLLRLLRIMKLGKTYDMERLAIVNCSNNNHGEFKVLPDEIIERVVPKHPIVLLLALVLPLFFISISLLVLVFFQASMFGIAVSLLFFFFAVVFFIKAWLDYNYDVIYITNHRVIFQNRELFGSITNDVSYQAITNVVPDNTGIMHWLLGFGDIKIETASNIGIIDFLDSSDPHSVVQHISKNREKSLRGEHSHAKPTPPENVVGAGEKAEKKC